MTTTAKRYQPIEDYALIGDCRAAALISSGGSIDWLCWPRFDSPSIFCGLLDVERGGSFGIVPLGVRDVLRAYVGDTAVLRTTFETEQGTFVLTDCMPIASPRDRHQALLPEHELVRRLECTRGSGSVDVHFAPRPDFARRDFRLASRGTLGIRVETGHGLLTLRTDFPMRLSADKRDAGATVELKTGESIACSLTLAVEAAAVVAPLAPCVDAAIARTEALWRDWSGRTTYDGPYRDQVVRSAIVVRLLTYAPSGAPVAAVTTSLPETRGGSNNWDYRFCWLRDAAFTVRGMLALGHGEEAEAFTNWLLHSTRLTQPRLDVLYDVYGRPPAAEAVVQCLSGYEDATPVRTGNGADGQVQLDSYGEVIDAVWRVACARGKLGREACAVLESFGLYVCAHWRDKDAGIWEPRGEPTHHTHSLVLCWTALDRLIDLQDRGHMRARHRARLIAVRDEIRRTVDAHGYDAGSGTYLAVLDGTAIDATALQIGWYGFDDPASARMRGTFARLRSELSPRPGLLFRNDTAGDDGAFGICSFWMAEHLAAGGGTLAEAREAFDATLAFANGLGLFSEMVEPVSGRALGNVPQTFTHVGLINAALSIAERERQEATSP